jgi:hypothetical protein
MITVICNTKTSEYSLAYLKESRNGLDIDPIQGIILEMVSELRSAQNGELKSNYFVQKIYIYFSLDGRMEG